MESLQIKAKEGSVGGCNSGTNTSKSMSPEYIVLDEDDNEIRFSNDDENYKYHHDNNNNSKKRCLTSSIGAIINSNAEKKPKLSKKKSKNKLDIRNLPTLLTENDLISDNDDDNDDLNELNVNKINLNEFYNEWKDKNHEELLLIDDYIYKDSLIKNLKPHEAYVYTLGLNLVLDNVVNTYKKATNSIYNSNNKKESNNKSAPPLPSSKVYNLNIGIENEHDFLSNIDTNTTKINTLNKTLGKHTQIKYKCKICNFKSDNIYHLDSHLIQPHNPNTKSIIMSYRDTMIAYVCNYCNNFKTQNRDEYAKHLFYVHKRIYNYIKPLSAYMCGLCEYECREKFRIIKHQEQQCSYLTNQNSLNYIQKPTIDDDYDYEFMFPTTQFLSENR